jgi:hypothetical protein
MDWKLIGISCAGNNFSVRLALKQQAGPFFEKLCLFICTKKLIFGYEIQHLKIALKN